MTDIPTPEDRVVANLALDTEADAKNRGWRTALQFLIVGVIVDIIPILYGVLDDLDAGADLNVANLVRALIRPVLGGLLAVAMRYQAPPPTPTG